MLLKQDPYPISVEKIALDRIKYSSDGTAILFGRCRSDMAVLVYLDNVLHRKVQPANDGSWSLDLGIINPGVYTLRLDEVDGQGTVLSRIESPFKQEAKDLGINRMFKGSYDIYNFITDDVSKIVQDNFEITELPINSSATDIFINDNNCILELVPQELDYLTIPNQTGTNIRGILIGDYKVNQPKNGSITREEVMQTPSLENNNDTQAF